MTIIDLAAIRARRAAITPGPWGAGVDTHPKDGYWEACNVYAVDTVPLPNLVYATNPMDAAADGEAADVSRWADQHERGTVASTHNDSDITDEEHDANQRFIAHAPGDVADLLAYVDMLAGLLDALTGGAQ